MTKQVQNIVWMNNGRFCYALSVPVSQVAMQIERLKEMGFKPWMEA